MIDNVFGGFSVGSRMVLCLFYVKQLRNHFIRWFLKKAIPRCRGWRSRTLRQSVDPSVQLRFFERPGVTIFHQDNPGRGAPDAWPDGDPLITLIWKHSEKATTRVSHGFRREIQPPIHPRPSPSSAEMHFRSCLFTSRMDRRPMRKQIALASGCFSGWFLYPTWLGQ